MRSSEPRTRTDAEAARLKLLGDRIRALRKSKLVPQDVLARSADIPRAHMTNIEAGRVDIRISMLGRIARALDVHEHDLLDNSVPIDRIPSRDG
jgi:transcriptional regulator with XRE-family HTH domain